MVASGEFHDDNGQAKDAAGEDGDGRRDQSLAAARPVSLALRIPRSNSVRQLVQQWEVTASPVDPAPTAGIGGVAPSISAHKSVKRSDGEAAPERRPLAPVPGSTYQQGSHRAESAKVKRTPASSTAATKQSVETVLPPPQRNHTGPTAPANEHGGEGLKSAPTHAIVKGTLGKMDWTPKYGLGMHFEATVSEKEHHRGKLAASAPIGGKPVPGPSDKVEQGGKPRARGAAPIVKEGGNVVQEKRRSPAASSGGRQPPGAPLRSVPPQTSLPSPASSPINLTRQSFGPSTPSSDHASRFSASPVSDKGGDSTPQTLLYCVVDGSPTLLQSVKPPMQLGSRLTTDGKAPVEHVSTIAAQSADWLSTAPAKRSDLTTDTEVPLSTNEASSSRTPGLASPTADATLRGATLRPKDGLVLPSDGRDIFDLDCTKPRQRTNWLPSVFRTETSLQKAAGDKSSGDPVPTPEAANEHGQNELEGLADSPRDKDPETISLAMVESRESPSSQDSHAKSSSTLVSDNVASPTFKYKPSRFLAAQAGDDGAGRLPVPADHVFAVDAPPLHLPALDAYLNNAVVFRKPRFSDAFATCTHEERTLFGLYRDVEASELNEDGSHLRGTRGHKSPSRKARRSGAMFEVAGGQMNLPPDALSSDTDASKTPGSQQARGLWQQLAGTYAKLDTREGHELGAVVAKAGCEADADNASDDGKTVFSSEENDLDKRLESSSTECDEFKPARFQKPSSATASKVSLPVTSAVPSRMSTASHPITRQQMFPPLMLLKEDSLDELKSNAIGPRKPPGGIWGVQILGNIFDFIIGAEGSNYAASLFRLELFRDFAQLMAVNLHFEKFTEPLTSADQVRKFVFQTLPSLLGLDFVSVFGYAVIFFVSWICVTALALWQFWRMTNTYDPNRNVEGFESQGWIYKTGSRGSKLLNTSIVFLLSTLYLPLSKLAVDALVWSSDFWPVENPYVGGVDNPVLEAMGDSDTWRDPLDFCYTTTMRRDGFNWAYIIVPMAAATFCLYTLWFPWRMMKTIKGMLPDVSEYNELGKKRTEEEMEIEYARLLNRDKSPLNFLYNSYRRKWGFYKPMYILLFKFSNLIIICVLAKDNCLFRSLPTKTMLLVQQVTLIVIMSFLLGVHLSIKPFVDQIANRSEMVSRSGYVLTAVIGLLVALNVQGSTVYNTMVLYLIQGVSYTGNIYFSLVGTSIVSHQVKRWQKRVDFSIDIFSPLLNVQKHIKRRVWQETLSIILLSGRGLHMPLDQVIAFSMSESDAWPPYLLDFRGSAAERHVENLKIVKQIGLEDYEWHVRFSRTDKGARMQELAKTIQRSYAGPDAYYRPAHPPFPSGVSSFFGKAFVVPFPPTIVIRYDQGLDRTLQITSLEGFEAFVSQNKSEEVRSKRRVRQALRALDGQRVLCPYVHNVPYGNETYGPGWAKRLYAQFTRSSTGRYLRASTRPKSFAMATPVSYIEGTLCIERRQEHQWNGYNFSSGFYVKIVYDQSARRQESNGAVTTLRETIEVSGSRAFGLPDDFDMTSSMARFFKDNEGLVKERVSYVEEIMQRYRDDFEREARWKERKMPYSFETDIFDNHLLTPEELRWTLHKTVKSRALAELPRRFEGSITLLYERLAAINRSPLHRFWWLLFDELWRINSQDYKLLRTHRRSFSPQFPTSIAYTPMPRAELEAFLYKRGLWKKDGKKGGPFNRGLLNRIYFYLNEVAFAGHHDCASAPASPELSKLGGARSSPHLGKAARGHAAAHAPALIPYGLGTTPQNAAQLCHPSFDNLKSPTRRSDDSGSDNLLFGESRLTGGGTIYSMSSIRDRSAYMWEQRMDGRPLSTRLQRLKIRTLQWLNLSPFVFDFDRQRLFLYVELVPANGEHEARYELLPERSWAR
ncbi:hypothetical protein ACQY0O_000947 [Thecaphora frezii]